MDKTIIDYPVNAYFLRCHWPYRSDDLPEDLYSYLAGYDGLVSTMRCAYSHTDAQDLLERYRTVRLGMGSKPLPTQHRNHNPIGYEASIVPATRIAYDRDDWPSYTQVHPDWEGWSLTVSPVLGRYPDGRS
jgi:hypothetical protein